MADNSTPLVYVEKDGELRTHFAKKGEVTWSDGRRTQEWLPACGTKVDVSALQSYRGYAVEATCGRCNRNH